MQAVINDVRISFDKAGSGVPLLLIHGYPLNRTLWEPQLSGLSDSAEMVIPDLRGHGESEVGERLSNNPAFTMDLLAEDCNALLDHLQVTEPVVVGGLSMGGYIAFAFYRKFARRVAGLILAATRAGEDTPEGKNNRDKAADLARQSGVSAIAESMLPKMMSPLTYQSKPQLIAQVLNMMKTISINGIVGDLMGMKNRHDSTLLLPQIEVPVLLLHGSDDQLIPLHEAQAMQTGIPNAKLVVIPEAGHLLPLEQADLTNQAISEFLKQFG